MAVAVLFGILGPVAEAEATVIWSPNLTITGEPTAEEITTLQTAWVILTSGFPSSATCMDPLTVHVVDRVEDHYSTPISFSIAAFYRYPPNPTVFIEHGKVNLPIAVHEFAHHMDQSCGFGRSDAGKAFLAAEGYDTDHNWIRGTSWSRVPAERFAEGVLTHLGIGGEDIFIGPEGLAIIEAWAVTERDGAVTVAPGLIVV
jgi:hypothetical protein